MKCIKYKEITLHEFISALIVSFLCDIIKYNINKESSFDRVISWVSGNDRENRKDHLPAKGEHDSWEVTVSTVAPKDTVFINTISHVRDVCPRRYY